MHTCLAEFVKSWACPIYIYLEFRGMNKEKEEDREERNWVFCFRMTFAFEGFVDQSQHIPPPLGLCSSAQTNIHTTTMPEHT